VRNNGRNEDGSKRHGLRCANDIFWPRLDQRRYTLLLSSKGLP